VLSTGGGGVIILVVAVFHTCNFLGLIDHYEFCEINKMT